MKTAFDTTPLSQLAPQAPELVERVRSTGRPIVLTDRGESAAVIVDAGEYERMVEEIDLLRDVRTAMQQIDAGGEVDDAAAKAELRSRFAR